MNTLTKSDITSLLKPRESSSSKRDHGHALLVAGQKGTMGAAVIAAKAGLRSGVGLLTVSVPSDERGIVQSSIPEAMLLMREDNHIPFEHYTAIGIGPGFGTGNDSEALLTDVLKHATCPLVLDADALTILSTNEKLFDYLPAETIITPHHAEFDRLFGDHHTTEERIQTAIHKAHEYNIILVLKGHQTAIITAEQVFYNSTGNAGLAKGGSGDALTGMITSFLAQKYPPLAAAKLAVYLHGLAADSCLQEQSMESMIISDVIDNLGKAFNSLRT
ncbi:MAG: NAD(P)H-hydrate dehydratase [Fluviicola sp.]|nr:NAD(P)H-hydrate dehydratase [Fluviicola sp.]